MEYRLYAPADFPALYAVEELCFEPPFRFSRAYMRQLIGSANSATWIAEDGADPKIELIGFSIVEWPEEQSQSGAYIETIEVLPAFRGRGTLPSCSAARKNPLARPERTASPCMWMSRMPLPSVSTKAAATHARAGKSTITRATAPPSSTRSRFQAPQSQMVRNGPCTIADRIAGVWRPALQPV